MGPLSHDCIMALVRFYSFIYCLWQNKSLFLVYTNRVLCYIILLVGRLTLCVFVCVRERIHAHVLCKFDLLFSSYDFFLIRR
jgi:hypothetical protein